MVAIFSGAIGMWNKELGLKIEKILQKDYSKKLKAALLAFFYE
jgi:hypothetical protein